MARHDGSSARWLHRQRRDRFALMARREGRVSRAHYKLRQLDQRFRLLRQGLWVLELGAAPGGWTAYLAERTAGGRLLALDPKPIAAAGDRVEIIQGRLGDPATERQLAERLSAHGRNRPLDLVLSDMAPNISGVDAADQAEAMRLAQLAAEAAFRWLQPGGALVVKIRQGEGLDVWLAELRGRFARLKLAKPAASRKESRESYAVAQGFLGPP